MSSTRFGLIEENTKFNYVFGMKEVVDKGSFFPKSRLESGRFWFALRLRDGRDISKYHFQNGAAGPYVYRHGVDLQFDVSDALRDKAKSEGKNVQLVVILADPDIDLTDPFTLQNVGTRARVVHIPSEPLR